MGGILFRSYDTGVATWSSGRPGYSSTPSKDRVYTPGSGLISIPWNPRSWTDPRSLASGSVFDMSFLQNTLSTFNAPATATINGKTALEMLNAPGNSIVSMNTPAVAPLANGLTFGLVVLLTAAPTNFQAILGTTANNFYNNGWGVSEVTGGTGTLNFWVSAYNSLGTIPWVPTLNVPHVVMGTYDAVSGDMALYVDGVSVGTSNIAYNAAWDTGYATELGAIGGGGTFGAVEGSYGPAATYEARLGGTKFDQLAGYLADYAGIILP